MPGFDTSNPDPLAISDLERTRKLIPSHKLIDSPIGFVTYRQDPWFVEFLAYRATHLRRIRVMIIGEKHDWQVISTLDASSGLVPGGLSLRELSEWINLTDKVRQGIDLLDAKSKTSGDNGKSILELIQSLPNSGKESHDEELT